jgi:hypothetical protein
MSAIRWLAILVLLASTAAVACAAGPPAPPKPPPEQEQLRRLGLDPSAAGLLRFLRDRSGVGPKEPSIDALARQLGDDDFETRKNAADRLVSLGHLALPALRRAQADKNTERSRQARACLAKVEAQLRASADLAAIRELLRLRPKGTEEALLGLTCRSLTTRLSRRRCTSAWTA